MTSEAAGPSGSQVSARKAAYLARPSDKIHLILWRAYRGLARQLALLGGFSLFSGLSEAAAMGCIVALVSAIGSKTGFTTLRVPVVHAELMLSTNTLLAICLATVVARLALQTLEAWVETRTITRYEADLRRSVFGAFCDASWDVQAKESLGRVQTMLTETISQARATLKSISQAIVNLTNFVILAAVAFVVDPLAVVMLGGIAAALFLLVRPIDRRGKQLGLKKAALNVDFASAVNEAVVMAQEIRVFRATGPVKRLVGAIVEDVRGNRTRADFLSSMVGVLYQNGALLVVVSGLGAISVLGASSLTNLGVVALLLIRALGFSQGFQTQLHYLVERVAFVEQLSDVERRYDHPAEANGTGPVGRVESLNLDDVTFGYDPARPVLSHFTASVQRGEAIGIVGPSGAGKSTLIQLLLRLRKPTAGALLANGLPAEGFSLDSWYQQVSLVPQEPRLLNATVAENIRFFRHGITQEDVESAAKMAGIHEEILAMPHGYLSTAGERGGALSGGQRQRICIARALASKPDVLIFDEPTSALDVHSESKIFAALQALKGQVTLFIIAHRLSTLNVCDKVMVIKNGQLQGFDSQTNLAANDPYYAEALKLAQLR